VLVAETTFAHSRTNKFGSRRHSVAARPEPRKSHEVERQMGLWDLKKTWHFRVNASTDDCVTAFTTAFERRVRVWGVWPVNCGWSVHQEAQSEGAPRYLATYNGRAGVMVPAGTHGFLSIAPSGERLAVGSTVCFQVQRGGSQTTEYSMWLSSFKKGWFFAIADARFIRPYMRRVIRRLKSLDPTLGISTS